MDKKKLIGFILLILAIIAVVSLVIIFGKEKEENAPVISAEEVSQGAPEYYGKLVENYKVPGVDNWRIYYADSDNIYLIADDYISKEYVPDASNRSITATENGYGFTFFGVYEDYKGAEDIKEPVRKWLSEYLKINSESTNINARVIAYLLDTSIWNGFADTTYAEYAVGAPTIELFCASYKDANKDRYLDFKMDDEKKYGYKIKWNNVEKYSFELIWYNELIEDNFNGIYVKADKSKAFGMILASPLMTPVDLTEITNEGNFGSRSFNLRDLEGLRPIVCLKSGVGIVKQDNGNYILK